MYVKVVPVIVALGKANVVSSLDSCTSTISKAFSDPNITEFNTKVQMKVTLDPTTAKAASLLVVSVREDGVGTTRILQAHMHALILYNIHDHSYRTITDFDTHFES